MLTTLLTIGGFAAGWFALAAAVAGWIAAAARAIKRSTPTPDMPDPMPTPCLPDGWWTSATVVPYAEYELAKGVYLYGGIRVPDEIAVGAVAEVAVDRARQ